MVRLTEFISDELLYERLHEAVAVAKETLLRLGLFAKLVHARVGDGKKAAPGSSGAE